LRRYLKDKSERLKRFVAAMGGLMVLVGTILLGFAVLATSGFLNVGLLLQQKYLLMFAFMMIVIGVVDAFAAIVIARW
jgi:hypothetical protein